MHVDINDFTSLFPKHISAYGLTVEMGTPLYQSIKRGVIKTPDNDTQADMMEVVIERFEAAGFKQYEISNFSIPGFESKHNQGYWQGFDYLGIGAGAHSYSKGSGNIDTLRWSNLALPNQYQKNIEEKGSAVSWSETLTEDQMVFERFYLGLRQNHGLSMHDLKNDYGQGYYEKSYPLISSLEKQGLIEIAEDIIKLSRRGMLLADSVFEELASIFIK